MGPDGHATTIWIILETYDEPFRVTLYEYEAPSGKPCLRMHAWISEFRVTRTYKKYSFPCTSTDFEANDYSVMPKLSLVGHLLSGSSISGSQFTLYIIVAMLG